MKDLGLKHPVMVLGQTRSGTSLVMQMLAAGGVRCLGEYPAYEDQVVWKPSLLAQLHGIGLKLVDPWNFEIPESLKGRVIVTHREHSEQAKSYVKWGNALGIPVGNLTHRRIAQSFAARAAEVDELAVKHAIDGSPLHVTFDFLIEEPQVCAAAIGAMLSPKFDIKRAAAQVVTRSPACYPGLLELQLIESREAGLTR